MRALIHLLRDTDKIVYFEKTNISENELTQLMGLESCDFVWTCERRAVLYDERDRDGHESFAEGLISYVR
jgi:hypothetical protein